MGANSGSRIRVILPHLGRLLLLHVALPIVLLALVLRRAVLPGAAPRRLAAAVLLLVAALLLAVAAAVWLLLVAAMLWVGLGPALVVLLLVAAAAVVGRSAPSSAALAEQLRVAGADLVCNIYTVLHLGTRRKLGRPCKPLDEGCKAAGAGQSHHALP